MGKEKRKLYVIVTYTEYHGQSIEMITTDITQVEKRGVDYAEKEMLYSFDLEEGKELTVISADDDLRIVER